MNGIVRLGFAMAVALGLTACAADGPTGLDASRAGVDANPQASQVQGPRPLTGNMDGIGVLGDPCSASPPGLTVIATGNGNVSHLGATTLQQTVCVDANFIPLGPSYVTLTAANGDRVEGVLTSLVFRSDGLDFDVAITGGTGRFAQASGTFAVRVIQAAPLMPFSASMEGWIEY